MIKAWTKVLADSRNRYFRIRRILYKWENPDLQVLRICSWRFKSEWNHDPKFLTTVKGANLMLPTERPSIFTLESCCFAPINMSSVLSPLSLSLSVSIHIRMSDIQRSMATIASVSLVVEFHKWKNPDLQVLWICSWRFKLEWKNVPKFLATVTGANPMLPTVRLSIFTLESCCFAPINMNSVLSSSRLSLSVSIHIRMSDIQCSMGTTGFVLEGSVRGRLIEFATSSSKIIGTVFDTRHITYIIRIA